MQFYLNEGFQFSLNKSSHEPFIEMEVKGFMRGKAFKENTMRMFFLLKESGVNKLLIKTKDLLLIDYENRRWVEKEFLPFVTSQGLRAVSFVKPENYLGMLSLEEVMFQMPEERLKGAYYESEQEARYWLRKVAV